MKISEESEEACSLKVGQLGKIERSTKAWGIGLIVLFFGLYFAAPVMPTTYSSTLTGWVWRACNSASGFLHGRFVPIAFFAMVWIAIKQAKDEEIRPDWKGLLLIAFGLLFFLMAVRTIQARLILIGLPFTIIGAVYYLAGFKVARYFIFPAFFWWFAIPVPGLKDALTGGLQIFITKSCYEAGVFFGMDLTREGSTISVAGSDLNIAEGCSGIRSLMALVMISAVYANYTQKTLWKKFVLFSSALPLAIIGNFGRIFTILILAQIGFGEFGKKTWHDWAGLLIFFPIALSGLYLVDYCLNFKTRSRKRVTRRAISKTKTQTEV